MIYFAIHNYTRLGNWLFQYAAALALDKNAVAVADTEDVKHRVLKYQDFFSGLNLITSAPSASTSVYKENESGYHPIVTAKDGDTIIDGFFQSPLYFETKRDLILSHYAPSEERKSLLVQKAGSWIDKLHVTSIHVRRGDYLRLQFLHPFVGLKYLREAISCIPQCMDFVVFSDDMSWCKRHLPKLAPEAHFWFEEGNSVVDDLYLQSLCQNNIISNSSFSWWAAWLNTNENKIVIAPSQWFGFVRCSATWRDIYPKNWIILQNHYRPLQFLIGVIQLSWGKFKIYYCRLRRKVIGR